MKTYIKNLVFYFLLISLLFGFKPDSIALAGSLLSHRALYEIKINKDNLSNFQRIVQADGSVVIEMNDVCEKGWATGQKINVTLTDMNGSAVNSEINIIGLESKDGKEYEFDFVSRFNGIITAKYVGSADRNEKSGGVSYSIPSGKYSLLPSNIIFPMNHLVMLIEAAIAGKRTLNRIVFDGGSDDGSFEVNALIGTRKNGSKKFNFSIKNREAHTLDFIDQNYWSIRQGFFSLKKESIVPEHEVTLYLNKDGVVLGFLLDQDDFSLVAMMKEIEIFEKSPC